VSKETIRQKWPGKSRATVATPTPASLNGPAQRLGNQTFQRLLRAHALQTRLAVSQPEDVYEREAECIANEVMRMPEPAIGFAPAPPRMQRLCGECTKELAREPMEQGELIRTRLLPGAALQRQTLPDEDELLQTRSGPGAAPEVSAQIEAAINTLRGRGQPLPEPVRAFMEPRFGADFRGVRAHTDAGAAELARAVDAQAFTVGRDVVFDSGYYAPDTVSGRYLLAHELTHVVQQGGATEIHRFTGEEHRQLGEAGSWGAVSDIAIGGGAFLTYGEVVAMAGDWFETLDEMRALSRTSGGQQELRWVRWRALGSSGTEPTVTDAIRQRAMDRYFRLAARNVSHFSAGGTAMAGYRSYHEAALRAAFHAGRLNNSDLWREALTTEAFGNHFLTDMFAGGHVRTPRDAIRRWYQAHYPASIGSLSLVTYMAGHMHAYLVREHPTADFFGQIPSTADMEARIRTIGGTALSAFSLGDIVSLAYHNRDNTGLRVVSDVDESGIIVFGGYHWTAMGDANLARSATTRDMAVAAIRASIAELESIRTQGHGNCNLASPDRVEDCTNAFVNRYRPFAAERFVPREDTGAPVSPNASFAWEWGSFNADMRSAVDDAVTGEIANTLADIARGQSDANVRAALNDFVAHLRAQGVRALEAATGTAAGP